MKKTLQIALCIILACALIAGVLFGVTAIRFTVLRAITVVGESMTPTLTPGQSVHIDTQAQADFYDIVVFYYVPDLSVNPAPQYNGSNAFFRCMPLIGKMIPDAYDNQYALYVKRVVGLGGDIVELRAEVDNGVHFVNFYRNGFKVEESIIMLDSTNRTSATAAYAREHTQAYWVDPTAPYTVPENCLYLLGDNRGHSDDSRIFSFGALPQEYVVGVVH